MPGTDMHLHSCMHSNVLPGMLTTFIFSMLPAAEEGGHRTTWSCSSLGQQHNIYQPGLAVLLPFDDVQTRLFELVKLCSSSPCT